MARLAKADAANNCFELMLPYGPGDNYFIPHALAYGMFVFVEWTGRHKRLRPEYQPSRPGLVAEFGSRQYPVQLRQIAGERLNHHSMDLAFELLRQALLLGYGPNERITVRFDADEMLVALGKSRGGPNRLWLADELTRLKTATFRLTSPGLKDWEYSVINNRVGDSASRAIKVSARYEVELNAQLVKVFAEGWCIVKGPAWRALLSRKAPLARMLLGLFETQKTPEPVADRELQERFGRGKLRRKDWLAELTSALDNLKAATNWHTCELRGDDVVVYKTAAAAADAERVVTLPQTPVLKAVKPENAPVAPQALPAPEVLAPETAKTRAAELAAFLAELDPFLVYVLARKHPELALLERVMGISYEWSSEQKLKVALEAWCTKPLADVKSFLADYTSI